MIKTAIYIHIPFCKHKCIYCDFYSVISIKNKTEYLNALKKEIRYYSLKYGQNREIISVFFGGGTPSYLEPDYISQILNEIQKNFKISSNAEITLETNPGSVMKTKLKNFKKTGINRLSIGVQSFNDDELKFLTRIHSSKEAVQTVNDAANIGFENISIDLIFNLPNQTKKIWIKNLNTAVSLPIKHISAYSLILEKGTILNKMVLNKEVSLQNADYDAELYKLTIDFLSTRNFIQYEVSNFAKEGFQCIHNNAYWNYTDYLGFGCSAHSFIDKHRWWNLSNISSYINSIEQKNKAVKNEETLSLKDQMDEYVMLALRSKGINLFEFSKRFSVDWLKKNDTYLELLEKEHLLNRKNNLIKLTKNGYAVCDEILSNLI